MKPIQSTEMYRTLRENLQTHYDPKYPCAFVTTKAELLFQRVVNLTDTSGRRDSEYVEVSSNMLLKEAVESVLSKCGVEDMDVYKLMTLNSAMSWYDYDTYRLLPIEYLETMYQAIVEHAPHVLSPTWKDAFMAGVEEANQRAGRNSD